MNNNNLELNNDEKNVIEKINDIYDSIKVKNKNINEIINNIKNLVDDDDDTKYLKALLYPEKYKGIKMPNQVPLPSCTFQLHSTKILTSHKEFRIIFNPYFLYNSIYCSNEELGDIKIYEKYGKISNLVPGTINNYKKFYYFNLTSLYTIHYNEYTKETRFLPEFIDQGIPDFYSKYRLISACIMLKYIGKAEESSGIIGGSIITENSNSNIGGNIDTWDKDGDLINSNYFSEYDKYIDYKLFVNNFYNKEYFCSDGIKLVYFPLDNSYNEFQDVIKPENVIDVLLPYEKYSYENKDELMLKLDNNYKDSFKFYIYGLGLPEGINNNFKLDIYCNYECLPNPKYLDFLSINIYDNNLNIKKKQNIINILRNKCIMKINDYDNLLDWKQILKQIKKKKININYDKLNDDMKIVDEEYEKLKNEINENMNIENDNLNK